MLNENTLLDIWKQRADKFNNIAWVTNNDLLSFIYQALQLNGDERVLCAGIGTGILAKFILNKSSNIKMYGLDSSKEMIDFINDDRIVVRIGDLRNIPFIDGLFDRVIFRNVLHHCVGYTSDVIDETRRILKDNGKIIICEGIPINDDCVSDFSQIVTLKENRLVFTPENFRQMLYQFNDVCAGSIILKQQSVMNWIDNCVEDASLRAKILSRQKNSSEIYKKSANMVEIERDVLVDMKFLVVRGEK